MPLQSVARQLTVTGSLSSDRHLHSAIVIAYAYNISSLYLRQSNSKLDELKGSLYMRMFGNEMSFQRFQGLQSFTSATSFNMLDFLIKLSKDHDVSMTQSMVSDCPPGSALRCLSPRLLSSSSHCSIAAVASSVRNVMLLFFGGGGGGGGGKSGGGGGGAGGGREWRGRWNEETGGKRG